MINSDNRPQPLEPEPAILLENIRYSWAPGKTVLDIPLVSIHQGEKVFIRGSSGSGKTTLLGLLGGVLLPQRGTVKVLNQDICQLTTTGRDRFRAQHIGFIFQMFNLIPYLSVTDNVTLPVGFSPLRQSRVKASGRSLHDEALRLLHDLGMNDQEQLLRPVTELSIGQQQRVAAARAMIGKPELVIADEPTSALDTDTREAFIRLLFNECEAAGSTLIFVSHDPALEPLFDKTIALDEINRASTGEKRHSSSTPSPLKPDTAGAL
ncbi:MAG: ABC transporter ATP-binding protein [Endozoicomonas sp.]